MRAFARTLVLEDTVLFFRNRLRETRKRTAKLAVVCPPHRSSMNYILPPVTRLDCSVDSGTRLACGTSRKTLGP